MKMSRVIFEKKKDTNIMNFKKKNYLTLKKKILNL